MKKIFGNLKPTKMKVTIEGVEYERVKSHYGCIDCMCANSEETEITMLCIHLSRKYGCDGWHSWQLAEPVNPNKKEEEKK